MSGKTKADIEAENRELKGSIGYLEDEVENLRGYIKLLHDLSDEDRRDLKIEGEAHDATIAKAVSLSDKAIIHAHDAAILKEKNKNRGGNSYQSYKPVYNLAERYFRMKRQHDSKYFPGTAATEVRKHCLRGSKYKKSSVPSQKAIRENLKKVKYR